MALILRLVEQLSAGKVNHVVPVAPRAAVGLVATVYDQLRREFLVAPPLTLHSPAPDVLAGVWAVVRETLVCGDVPRARKEAVATAVSQSNACAFCVDAHLMALEAAGEAAAARAIERNDAEGSSDTAVRALVRWARATRTAGDPLLAAPPFTPAEAPEIIGTALTFHYVNRMVHLFCDESPIPVPGLSARLRRPMRRLGAPLMADWVAGRHEPGRGLALVPAVAPPPDLGWAAARPAVAAAWAGFADVAERRAREATSPAVLAVVAERVAAWRGEEPPLGRAWLDDAVASLGDGDRPAARLALSAALAPARTDPEDIRASRRRAGSDAAVVALAAWASLMASRRIGTWIAPGP